MRNKPLSSIPPWPLRFLPWVPGLTFLDDRLQTVRWNKPFSPCFRSWWFITAIESLTKTLTYLFLYLCWHSQATVLMWSSEDNFQLRKCETLGLVSQHQNKETKWKIQRFRVTGSACMIHCSSRKIFISHIPHLQNKHCLHSPKSSLLLILWYLYMKMLPHHVKFFLPWTCRWFLFV